MTWQEFDISLCFIWTVLIEIQKNVVKVFEKTGKQQFWTVAWNAEVRGRQTIILTNDI